MTEAEKLRRCSGCRDDFYNEKNSIGIKHCWMLAKARMVERFQIGTWTQPTQPGAFTKVRKLNCWCADGLHFYDKLPDFVKLEDVN